MGKEIPKDIFINKVKEYLLLDCIGKKHFNNFLTLLDSGFCYTIATGGGGGKNKAFKIYQNLLEKSGWQIYYD